MNQNSKEIDSFKEESVIHSFKLASYLCMHAEDICSNAPPDATHYDTAFKLYLKLNIFSFGHKWDTINHKWEELVDRFPVWDTTINLNELMQSKRNILEGVGTVKLVIGNKYKWKHDSLILFYIGVKGGWHQFTLNGKVWCECDDTDLKFMEQVD